MDEQKENKALAAKLEKERMRLTCMDIATRITTDETKVIELAGKIVKFVEE